ncbi:MAG: hypothetical protein GX847_11540 [Clostridiales bacterium]|nr:hypothetical protein [Clostridiales bacterium]
MKLNMQLIMEFLDEPVEHIVGSLNGPLTLRDIYPFLGGRPCDASDILYIATWKHIVAAERFPRFMMCVGGGDMAREMYRKNGIEGLILNADCDPLALQRSVQELFSRFGTIERDLLNTLIENRPIRDILNACAMFMECHVSLYGAEFMLLGYSDVFLPDENDTVWQQTVEARKSVVPMIPREKMHQTLSGQKESPRSSFITLEGLPNLLNVGFDYGDSRFATMVFCEVKKPINAHYQWLSDYIADIVSPVLTERYNTFMDVRNYFRTSVATALRYANTDSTFLLNNLARLGWQMNDDYQIVLIRLMPENRHVSHFIYNYENVFAGSYSDCIALRYEDYIVMLLHGEACDVLPQQIPALKKQLSADNGICSVGIRFCDFTQLKLQYDLTTLPLRVTTKPRRINYYREHMETHLVNELSSCFPVRATCHHGVFRVEEHDKANGTDFLNTLETYLMNNRSLLLASEKLFIHRSTLTYRLKCMGKIVPMNLDDPCERLHILLSCIALRILAKSEADSINSASNNDTTKKAERYNHT